MFEIDSIDGNHTPRVSCDSCGKEIFNAQHGAVLFKNFTHNITQPCLFVHKGFVSESDECFNVAATKIRSQHAEFGWCELSQYLNYLISNINLMIKR